MILRPVRPASPSGPPITNGPVGLTCQTVFAVSQPVGHHLADVGLDDRADVGAGLSFVEVLGREHQARDLDRLAALVAQRDLALGVRPEPGLRPRLARLGQPAQHRVGVVDRRRHEFGGLVDRVAEHDALVAGALLLVCAAVHALGDVRRTGRGCSSGRSASPSGSPSARSRCRARSRARCPRPALSTSAGPRTSPPTITRSVVAKVSQATRASGSAVRKASSTASEIRSQTLSGWPSDTDSEANV